MLATKKKKKKVKKVDEEEKMCMICFESTGKTVKIPCCKQRFHKDCLRKVSFKIS